MKTVLITGVSRGIGRALANKFLQEGFVVYGTTQDGENNISDYNLKIFKLDLINKTEIASIVEQIPNIDILINNAGVLLDEEETSVKIDLLQQTLEVNLIGTINLTESLIPKINKGGHMVNVSSTAGSLTKTTIDTSSHFPYHYPAYKISKCALNMYTRTLAMRMINEKLDIKVSSVHPGWVKTEMGGEDAPISPEEASEDIYKLAINTEIESGQFWFKGNKIEW